GLFVCVALDRPTRPRIANGHETARLGGLSAGGHLALTTGMIPASLDELQQPTSNALARILTPELINDVPTLAKPAAIISWCGIADVADVTSGSNAREYAIRWIGNQP